MCGGSHAPTGVSSARMAADPRLSTAVSAEAPGWNLWPLMGGVPAATLSCYPLVVSRGWDSSCGGHGVLSGGLVVVGS